VMEQKAQCRRGRLISERIGQKVRARGPPTMTHHSAVPSLLLPTTTTADHDTVHAPVAVLPIVSPAAWPIPSAGHRHLDRNYYRCSNRPAPQHLSTSRGNPWMLGRTPSAFPERSALAQRHSPRLSRSPLVVGGRRPTVSFAFWHWR
jgi:hypothetical protein